MRSDGAQPASALSSGTASPLLFAVPSPAARPVITAPTSASTAAPTTRRRLSDIDFAPDLGDGIGSRRWWRGMGTLVGLIGAVWGLSPGIRPVVAQTMLPGGEGTLAAVSAQAITPLALGADTGRRMAATAAVRPLADRPERPRVELTATLGRSDSFARVLERAGVGGTEAGRAAELVNRAFDVGAIAPGTRMDLVLGRRASRGEPRPLERLFFRADLGLALAVQRASTGLELVKTEIPVDSTPLRVSGTVGDSLYRSARAAGAPADAVADRPQGHCPRASAGSATCPHPPASTWWWSSGAPRPERSNMATCCSPGCGATGGRRS